MKLYVARHGQTRWNAENKICGRTDLPLTEEGLRQAEELAGRMKDLAIDRIIASPLARALHMAKIISDHCGAPVSVDKRLIEQDYGIFEGLDRGNPEFLANKRQFAVRYPGGESMMQLAGRVYPFLKELRREYPKENILLVCHGGICRVIRTYFVDMTNEEYFSYSPDNASVECYEL